MFEPKAKKKSYFESQLLFKLLSSLSAKQNPVQNNIYRT